MKIESDQIEWLAGVRAGETLGSPIAMLVWNRDWEHWRDVMAPEADAAGAERRRPGTPPPPGPPRPAGSLEDGPREAPRNLGRGNPRRDLGRPARGAPC